MRRIVLWISVLRLCAVTGFGQTTATTAAAVINGTLTVSTPVYNTPVITGSPYSADRVGETVQTLPDGTLRTRPMPMQREYRDSQGRTRAERHMGVRSYSNAQEEPVIIEIRDPVAGLAYYLDVKNGVAHRVALQPAPPVARAGAQVAPLTAGNAPQVATRPLGSQVVEGLQVQGAVRTTTGHPLFNATETWISPDLKLVVLLKSGNSRGTQTTVKLTGISRAEPDITLFRPPAGYTVVNESGPTITIGYTAPRSDYKPVSR